MLKRIGARLRAQQLWGMSSLAEDMRRRELRWLAAAPGVELWLDEAADRRGPDRPLAGP